MLVSGVHVVKEKNITLQEKKKKSNGGFRVPVSVISI